MQKFRFHFKNHNKSRAKFVRMNEKTDFHRLEYCINLCGGMTGKSEKNVPVVSPDIMLYDIYLRCNSISLIFFCFFVLILLDMHSGMCLYIWFNSQTKINSIGTQHTHTHTHRQYTQLWKTKPIEQYLDHIFIYWPPCQQQ